MCVLCVCVFVCSLSVRSILPEEFIVGGNAIVCC